MKTVRVGGVPEHFNYPWHYAINKGLFAKAGFDVKWSDVTGGSGEMCRMLEENQTDVALVLTEGIVKAHPHRWNDPHYSAVCKVSAYLGCTF